MRVSRSVCAHRFPRRRAWHESCYVFNSSTFPDFWYSWFWHLVRTAPTSGPRLANSKEQSIPNLPYERTKEKRLKIKIFPFLLHFYAGLPTLTVLPLLTSLSQTNTPNNITPQSALPACSCLTSLNTCTFPKHRSSDLHAFVRMAQQR